MKTKLFLLTVIGFLLTQSLFSIDTTNVSTKERIYWEFIKERLYNGHHLISTPLEGDILVKLDGASNQDSIIVNNLFHTLRQLIPNRKIDYWPKDNLNLKGLTILIEFNNSSMAPQNKQTNGSNRINENQFNTAEKTEKSGKYISTPMFTYKLNQATSDIERKQTIEYIILRSLCTFVGEAKEVKTFVDNAVFNSFDYAPANTVFNDADKFLIKKFYSNDFHKQFKLFMSEHYSQSYYAKQKNAYMELRGYIFAIICALVIFILSYKFFFNRNYKYKFLGYLVSGFLVAISFVLVGTIYKAFATNDDLILFIKNAGASTIIIALGLSTILFFLEKYIVKPTYSFSWQLVLKVFLLLILFIGFFGFLNIAAGTGPDKFINFCLIGLALAIGRGTLLFLKGITDSLIREKDVELSALKELKARAEAQSLHARVNPHFLYNSLNSIAGLIYSNPEIAEKMTLSLSDLYRYSINRDSELMSSIEDEVDMVRTYLEIEQIRFGERMSFNIEVAKELEYQLIPRFILQPLIENAIKHGISKIEGNGEVSLNIYKNSEGIIIEVADNGPDFEEGLVGGYGLQSLYDLLNLSYGNKAEVNWQNEPQKMIYVIIKY